MKLTYMEEVSLEEMATRVQILDEDVCVSLRANAHHNGMILTILFPTHPSKL